MKIKCLNFSTQIPVEETTEEFQKNCWISSNGEVWTFPGAKHSIAATYIVIFFLKLDDSVLRKGTFFNETFEGYLLRIGWVAIKNMSWLTGGADKSIFSGGNFSERQKSAIFSYCEFFKMDYQEMLKNNEN